MTKKSSTQTSKKETAQSQPNSKKSTTRFLHIISEVGQILLIILLLVVSVAGFGSRIPFLAERGLQFYGVISGSMEPTLPVGALIKVGQYKLDDLSAGDIITYTVPSSDPRQPNIVTHRIEEVDKQEEVRIIGEGENQTEKNIVSYEITTKGDANNVADSYAVKPNDILGKYEWHIPLVGYVSAFSQSATGFILMVIVPAVILIVWEVVSLVMHFKQGALAKSEAEIEKLKKELAQTK